VDKECFLELIAPLCDTFPAGNDLKKLANTSPEDFKYELLNQVFGIPINKG